MDIESSKKVNPGEEHSPAAPAGTRTRNLSITSPVLYQQAIPAAEDYLQNSVFAMPSARRLEALKDLLLL